MVRGVEGNDANGGEGTLLWFLPAHAAATPAGADEPLAGVQDRQHLLDAVGLDRVLPH